MAEEVVGAAAGRSRFLPSLGLLGRAAILASLTVGMIVLLTAVQITHAFLSATGGASGVSAVAIRDEARTYERYSLRRRAVIDTIGTFQDRQAEALSMMSDATVFQYFHKVQFRRFIFACYPDAQRNARSTLGDEGDDVSGLSWDFLLTVYQAAAEGPQPTTCPQIEGQTTEALRPLRASRLEQEKLFKTCAATPVPRDRLECLWNNVTFSVGLEQISQQRRESIETELRARRAALAELDGEVLSNKAFADPSGRAAVAAWLELEGGVVKQRPASLGTWIGPFIATIVTLPVLAQSAALALFAGALGGGVARIWELMGFRTFNWRTIDDAVRSLGEAAKRATPGTAAIDEFRSEAARLAVLLNDTKEAIGAFQRQHLSDANAPVLTACASGAGSALILWLLTTSGLFVLSGGDNVASASPSVLLAISLAAGLAYRQVIGVIFSIAEGVVSRGQKQP